MKFLWGARGLIPPLPLTVLPWDLSRVFRALRDSPFEWLLTTPTPFAQDCPAARPASVKRVGDLQPLSLDASCLDFGPNHSTIHGLQS